MLCCDMWDRLALPQLCVFLLGEEKARLMTSGNEMLLLGLGIKRHAVQAALLLLSAYSSSWTAQVQKDCLLYWLSQNQCFYTFPLLGLAGCPNASVTFIHIENISIY